MVESPKAEPLSGASNAETKAVPRAEIGRLIVLNDSLTFHIETLMWMAQTDKSERLQAAIDLIVQASEELSYVIDPE